MREMVEEMWKNEILLKWNEYWDARNNKLRSTPIELNIDEKDRLEKLKQLLQGQTSVNNSFMSNMFVESMIDSRKIDKREG